MEAQPSAQSSLRRWSRARVVFWLARGLRRDGRTGFLLARGVVVDLSTPEEHRWLSEADRATAIKDSGAVQTRKATFGAALRKSLDGGNCGD